MVLTSEFVIHFVVLLLADYVRLNHVLCDKMVRFFYPFIYFGHLNILFSTVKEPRWKTYKCFHYLISHYRTLEWRHVSHV